MTFFITPFHYTDCFSVRQIGYGGSELATEETELRELTDSALGKLQAMSDAEFAELELYPDFDQ